MRGCISVLDSCVQCESVKNPLDEFVIGNWFCSPINYILKVGHELRRSYYVSPLQAHFRYMALFIHGNFFICLCVQAFRVLSVERMETNDHNCMFR